VPTIQAVDTDDETLYVLRAPGEDPVVAYWPQPLLELRPDAVRVPAYGSDVDWPFDLGGPVPPYRWSLELTPEQRSASLELRESRKPHILVCEDCGKEITDPGDYRPLDLFRPQKGVSGKLVWDATKEKWVRRPAQGPKKRARRNGRRFRVYDLCRKCAGEALRQRAASNTTVMEDGKKRTLKTKERLEPKRGGRPRLLTDEEVRQAYKVYESTTLSRREIARRIWEAKEKGSWNGYDQALLYGWRRLKLPLRERGTQLGMSIHGTDGTKSRHWKQRCSARLSNGRQCGQFVRVIRTDTGSSPAFDGLCWNHARKAEREAA
jgi:hypothetical protein